MNHKQKIYSFLSDLGQNNSKEWMDANRKRYQEAKDIWLQEIDAILKRLAQYDPRMSKIQPKETIMRINNNRRFHPDKPVYRDNFAFSPSSMNEPAFYLHVSPSESFIGGGLYHADNEVLKKIRAAIDYDGKSLLDILNKSSFQEFYGGLNEDPEQLKTSPQGYNQEHEYIELLRRKNFTAIHPLTQKDVIADNFVDVVERAFVELLPLQAYLKRAVDFEE